MGTKTAVKYKMKRKDGKAKGVIVQSASIDSDYTTPGQIKVTVRISKKRKKYGNTGKES